MSKKAGTIHCYMKKGWAGYVSGYKKFTSNWDETFGKKELGCEVCDRITCICDSGEVNNQATEKARTDK